MSDKSLTHVGVRGMRWGVITQLRGGKKKELSADHVSSRKLQRSGAKRLSNEEIVDLTKRLQLEKSLRNIQKERAPYIRGANLVKGLLAGGALAGSVYAFAQTPMIIGIKDILTKKVTS